MIEGILAEWFGRLPQEVRTAYFNDGITHAAVETTRAQIVTLFEALRAEGIHVFYCRRVVNRILYGDPDPIDVKSLVERIIGSGDGTSIIGILNGQIAPKDLTLLAEDLRKHATPQTKD